jgi:hypothetical protein
MGFFAPKQRKVRTGRRLTAQVAIFALIVQMLLPFGQALAFSSEQSIEYQIICTASGIKKIPVDHNNGPVDPTNSTPCSFCLVHLAPVLAVPQVASVIVIDEPVEHAVFGLPAQQVQVSIWRSSLRPSRAPPLFV